MTKRTVTKLEKLPRNKYKIYIEGDAVFCLYGKELGQYQLEEGDEITEEAYRAILEEVLWKRSRRRAMELLKRTDKTEYELRRRLKQDCYPEEIIERTMEYLKGYHYLDDIRLAQNYVDGKKSTKSKAQIKAELYAKGVQKEEIAQVLENYGDDTLAIKKAIRKKTDDPENLDDAEKKKLAAYLYRKGFQSEEIRGELRLF